MEEVVEWKKLEDGPKEALETSYDNCIETKQAKAVELDNWKHQEVYEEVQNQGQSFVTTTWVVTEKYKEGIKATKACLVARSFKEDDLDRL